jgi:hypothetical protein
MIYASFKKRKPRKPNAEQRALAKSWSDMVAQYEPKKPIVQSRDTGFVYKLNAPVGRETPKIPSRATAGGNGSWRPNPVYTGDKIKGIGTMHKSNAVPVFSDEEAQDIAKMRRG